MTMQAPVVPPRSGLFRPVRQPPFAEFVALIAMMFATVALSIDGMLPALPQIGIDLGIANPNHAQLVVTAFVAGLGLGQLFSGPLSDSFGRRGVMAAGIFVYVLAGIMAATAPSLGVLLAARFLQGLGISAPRTVAVAMVRDRYQGRMMARVMSFVMTLFILVPAAAPFMGQAVMHVSGWRTIFGVYAAFGVAAMLWLMIRQPETLALPDRRPFRLAPILAAMREVLSNRLILLYIAAITLGFGALFALISTAQQIYEISFGKVESFPAWFAAHALLAGLAGPLNARLVMRMGMRRLVTWGFAVQLLASVLAAGIWMAGGTAFGVFFLWATAVFFTNGLLFGNLNALALEPVGHIAGLASSTVGAVSTLAAVPLAAMLGLAFNGTPLPLILGVALFAAIGCLIMALVRRVAPF